MTKSTLVLGRLVPVAGVVIFAAMVAGCSSTKSGGAVDAGRGGSGGNTSGTGGSGAGGSAVGSGGATAGSGGLGAGGFLSGGVGAGGTGSGGTPGGAGGRQTGGAGGAGAGGLGAGGTGEAADARPSDVPISVDSGSGGVGSGGRTGPAGGSGAGGTDAGGVAGSGGGGGSGGTGAPCTRVLDKDYLCRSPSYPPRAYLCAVSAPPPSAACVRNSGGSGDTYCCPDGFVSCPDSLPANDTACPGAVHCSYGSHPDLSCRTRADCSNGTWQVSTPLPRCSDPVPPTGCPATPVGGADCSPEGLACYYSTGDYCICAQCTRETPACILDAPIIWRCLAPPGDPCPAIHPNLGSVCALPTTTQCRYRCDLIAKCSAEGVWVRGDENCPICNAPDTPIATPDGNRPIASLAPGDLVYSVHRGQVSLVPIAEVGRQALRNHHVMRLVLATGTVLEISPGHPTADGRHMGDLAADGRLDGVRVVSAALVPYGHSHTYDILPASDTGTYYAGGVLIGSTMAPAPRLASVPAPACAVVASPR